MAANHNSGDVPADLARYRPQVLFAPLGEDGQRQLRHAAVTLVGCGALGCAMAGLLVRAGVGYLRLVDRDFVEIDNLHRQVLYDERDVTDHLPKAAAAAAKLRRINSAVDIEGIVADVNPTSIAGCVGDVELILDGTDNVATRYLINDYAVDRDLPWVHGACIGGEGRVLAIEPGRTPCFRCLWDTPPTPGALPTCDTAGIVAMAAQVVASFQVTEAVKILAGCDAERIGGLITVDVWRGRMRVLNVQAAYDDGNCPCCRQRDFEFLRGAHTAGTTSLCGRNAVQVMPAEAGEVNLRRLADRLPAHMRPARNDYLLRFKTDDHAVTVFVDGRAIVQGTDDPAVAHKVLARYVGL